MTTTRVGNVEILALLDLKMSFPYAAFFPTLSAEQLRPYQAMYPASGDAEMFHTNAQAYVLRSGGETILVDTGMGPGPHAMLGGTEGALPTDMRAHGVDPAGIQRVIFTHLHFDHVGWNLVDGSPAFPNARYVAPETDYTFFRDAARASDNPHIAAVVEPLERQGVLDLVSGEQAITDEITVIPTPGHTPGHQSLAIVSAGERAFILGDVAHHPAQVHEVDWNSGFDVDGPTAAATRRRIMDQAEAEGRLIALGHFPAPGIGRLAHEAGRRVFRAL